MENLFRIHHVAAHLCQLSVSTCMEVNKRVFNCCLRSDCSTFKSCTGIGRLSLALAGKKGTMTEALAKSPDIYWSGL